ncbi:MULTISPECIES: JAB domain-containing protein [Bombella]|uniref:RadC family protein n=1 Tax=Bombella pollinis TaxID=2967337 RepID=A0ABT3WMU0_9PROT|nr:MULTISPECIES: JAB domain-containing protein [Bombella]MCX5620469.1 RadC family protein [Bombella pollinis]MUG04646.1 DNA repair protein RadC [Bombella sp. ESL0378]MUG90186.1 DNA repair protein RadC [Bombella sp. ESL0385]
MRERILAYGAETLADYELLEVLLFYAIPRRDTKPQAKALLARFGTIGKLLQVAPDSLKDAGMSEKAIALLQLPIIAARALVEHDGDAPLQLSNSDALMRYAQGALQHVSTQTISLLCLDSNNRLIVEKELPKQRQINTMHRLIACILLECHATAVIIIYYHPQAPATALAADARGLKQALSALDITVHEGMLIAPDWHVSMSEAGLL